MRQQQSVTIITLSSSFFVCLSPVVTQTFALFPPSPPSVCIFFHPSLRSPSLPSVFCPNWRLKREFYILAASNDERPLITVYPCRWCTAVATWDTSISFYVVPLFLVFHASVYCLTDSPRRNIKHIGLWYDTHFLWSVVCEVSCK